MEEWSYRPIGAALVPLNTRLGKNDLEECLRRCGAKIVIFAGSVRKQDFTALLSQILEDGAALPELEHVITLDADQGTGLKRYADLVRACESQMLPEREGIATDGAGLMLFTSGSSGLPKPVMLGETQLVSNMRNVARRQGLEPEDRVLSFLPYFHVFGGVISTLAPILSGGSIIMLEGFEAEASLEAAQRERCTVVYSVAPCYQAWFDHPRYGDYDLSAVRTGVCSAGLGAMSAMAKRVRRELCAMHSLFGMTETTGVATFTMQDDPEDLATETAGRPMEGAAVRIVDHRTGEPCPPETEGEIQIRGTMMTGGYFRMPDENHAAFDPNGWFRTGDRGWLGRDGYLRVIGRLDDRLRSGGENIDPREVEAFIQSHPDIAKCFVVGVPDQRLGEIPVAFVILHRPLDPDTESVLSAYCRGNIANFKIPHRFFVVEDVPGWMHKVQLYKLREEAIAQMQLERRGC